MKKIIPKNQKGFTIVETLVAIAVLMIAISGPLVIASKGLTAALYSKDQMIASFLAQESLEVIKNLRDAGLKTSSGWMSKFKGCDNRPSNNPCDADPLYNDFINNSNCGDGCPIYFDDTTGFTSEGGSFTTVFKRYFYFEDVDGGTNQKIVHVVVTWNVGTIPFETKISALLTTMGQ